MPEPLIPAFRLLNSPECIIGFRCPDCGGVHTHGCGNRTVVQWRGSHCISPERRSTSYRLFVCGEVASERMLPYLASDDLAALNAALSPACDKL